MTETKHTPTPAKIDLLNLNPMKFTKLSLHHLIDEIEDHGREDGKFFVHLKQGYHWNDGYHEITNSFGTIKEAREALAKVERFNQ